MIIALIIITALVIVAIYYYSEYSLMCKHYDFLTRLYGKELEQHQKLKEQFDKLNKDKPCE